MNQYRLNVKNEIPDPNILYGTMEDLHFFFASGYLGFSRGETLMIGF